MRPSLFNGRRISAHSIMVSEEATVQNVCGDGGGGDGLAYFLMQDDRLSIPVFIFY